MYPISERMRAALRTSHTQVNSIVLYPFTIQWGSPPIDLTAAVQAGAITADITISATADVRRTLSMSVVDSTSALVPRNLGDVLTFPTVAKVAMGVRFGPDDEEVIPVGTFDLSRPETSDSGADLTIAVDGFDRSRRVRLNRWPGMFQLTESNPALAIKSIIQGRLNSQTNDSEYRFAATDRVLPDPLPIVGGDNDNDPWADCLFLAADHGRRLYVDQANFFVLEEIPDPEDQPAVASFGPDESDFLLLGVSRTLDDDPGYNGVIARAEHPALDPPIQVEVWDNNPLSPTFYLGPWGKRPTFWVASLATNTDELRLAAVTRLREVVGGSETVTFAATPNPALDVGDAIEVRRDRAGVGGIYVIEQIDLPLGGGAMSVTCTERRVAIPITRQPTPGTPGPEGDFYDTDPIEAAITAATTLVQVADAMDELGSVYGFDFRIPTETSTPTTDWTAPPLTSGMLANVKTTAIGCARAISQYPSSFVQAVGLDIIYFVSDLVYVPTGGEAGGMAPWPGPGSPGVIWIDAEDAPTDWVTGKVFHHEFAHLIQRTPEREGRWELMATLNHVNLPYGGAWMADYDVGTDWPVGYTPGGWASAGEDEAEIHAFWMTPSTTEDFDDHRDFDTILDQKFELWTSVVNHWVVAS